MNGINTRKRGNPRPRGKKLDFALAIISAIRTKYKLFYPMTLREIAALTQEISGPGGGCTSQNINRIEQVALYKLRHRLGKMDEVLEWKEHLR